MSHGAGRGFRRGVVFCFLHKHVHQGGSIQPRGATWNQKQQNILVGKTRSGKRDSIIDISRHTHSTGASPRRQMFLLTFTATVRYSEGPARLALDSIPYMPRRGAQAGGFPNVLMYYPLFQKGGHVHLLLGVLRKGPNEYGNLGGDTWVWVVLCCDVVFVVWSHTKGKCFLSRSHRRQGALLSLTVNLIILGLASSFV